MKLIVVCCLATFIATHAPAADPANVSVLREVKGSADAKPLYLANRAPLEPSPFMKLQIGRAHV